MVRPAARGHVSPVSTFVILVFGAGLVLCASCGHYGAPATPPAPFNNADSVPRDSILDYARSLVFDTNYGAGDQQRLMVGSTCPPWAGGGNCTYGPLVRIEPQAGSYRIADSAALAGGRIIARIITVDSAYPKLGLSAGDTTYWLIDGHGPAGLRSVLVSTDTSQGLVHRNTLEYHYPGPINGHGYKWKQAIAGFIWLDSDEGLWSTCNNNACCKVQ